MPTYRNFVTYTTWSEGYRAHVEQKISLTRPYALTRAGAERIIKRERLETSVRPSACDDDGEPTAWETIPAAELPAMHVIRVEPFVLS